MASKIKEWKKIDELGHQYRVYRFGDGSQPVLEIKIVFETKNGIKEHISSRLSIEELKFIFDNADEIAKAFMENK